ncbi:hypothetical protein ACFORL_01025 [Legionella dresdenensis]|uniref:Substrate of the Dot/Icm secretion system n=1 Tax=Legionella dresdenensis TaxID=450200 RepID=A0ABV8CBQ8_9GAMM
MPVHVIKYNNTTINIHIRNRNNPRVSAVELTGNMTEANKVRDLILELAQEAINLDNCSLKTENDNKGVIKIEPKRCTLFEERFLHDVMNSFMVSYPQQITYPQNRVEFDNYWKKTAATTSCNYGLYAQYRSALQDMKSMQKQQEPIFPEDVFEICP